MPLVSAQNQAPLPYYHICKIYCFQVISHKLLLSGQLDAETNVFHALQLSLTVADRVCTF